MNYYQKELLDYRIKQAKLSLRDIKSLSDSNGSGFAIINRCYYAIFYSVLALLVDSKFIGSKHSGVMSFFDKEFIKNNIFPKEFSEIIHDAFEMRNKSDYAEFVEYSKDEIQSLM